MTKKKTLEDKTLKEVMEAKEKKTRILEQHKKDVRRLERELDGIEKEIRIKEQEAEIAELNKKLAGKK